LIHPQGWPEEKKKKKKKRRVANPSIGGGWPPLRPWGWLDHHKTGRSGGGKKKKNSGEII
jgi:hypothetical protein